MEYIKLKESHMAGRKPEITLIDGSWVAGGSVRRWFSGEKQDSDIDVFLADKDSLPRLVEVNGLVERVRYKDRVVMFKNSPVQVILEPQFGNMRECIDHFDFTICQFAWDGNEIISGVEAILSVMRKNLAIHSVQAGYEVDTLRRAFKYQRCGYRPCIGTIRDLVASIRSATDEDAAKFNEISPDRWD